MTEPLAPAQKPRRTFLILRATRWLPTGLLIPVLVLLLVERGFSLAEIGLAAGAQGLTVLILELPTGGLSDALGRKPVLLLGTTIELVAGAGLLIADSVPLLLGVFVLFGIYRALESGPLDAWYVDAAQQEDPDIELEATLSAGGTVTGLAIATGSIMAGGLVALDPFADVNALTLPLIAALVLRGVDLIALSTLMAEDRSVEARSTLRASIAEVPQVIGATVRLVRGSHVLAGLVAVEFFWGFGMPAFEGLAPPKLAEATGDAERAAALLGPTATAAWIAAAAGAWVAPRLARRIGTAVAAMTLHALQAATVIAMALVAGPAGVIVFYIATLATHGAINPLYQSLLHEQADSTNRTTVLSAASMAAHPGGALGGIALGTLAERASVTTAMVVGAAVLLVTLPLYLPARRQHSDDRTDPGD